MAMDIIPKSLYPVVPNVPGVPAVLRAGAAVLDTLTFGLLGASSALDGLIGAEQVRWGVFNQLTHEAVAIGDSVVGVDYRSGARISDYPLEQGAFASYNKVATPFDAKVRMTCGGSEARRIEFLRAIEAAAKSLDLVTILTPEKSYQNANIEALDYRRESGNGAGMIVVELYLREIRQVAALASASPKAPQSADPKAQGQVQAAPASTSTTNAVAANPIK